MLKIRWVVLLILLSGFVLASLALADELVLKSGEKVEGKITDKTNKYVMIDPGIGMAVTYYNDDISTIDGQAPVSHKLARPIEKPALPVKPAITVKIHTIPVVPESIAANPKPQPKIPTVPTADTTKSAVAQESAKGEVHGRPFVVDQAKFDEHMNTLELRQGGDFFPDLAVELFLFKPQGSSWGASQLHIAPEAVGQNPHIYMKWMDAGKQVPDQKVYMSGYTLDISFDAVHDGKMHGMINLTLPDKDSSHVQGSFDALINAPMPGSQGTIVITPAALGNARPISSPIHMTFKDNSFKQGFPSKANFLMAFLAGLGGFALVIVIVTIIAFMIFPSLCLQYISQKANAGAAWMAWVPIANLFLMCKIADLRYTWLWLVLLVFIPWVGKFCMFGLFGFIWYKIALTLRKPGWWGILSVVPFVNLVALGYLAFSE